MAEQILKFLTEYKVDLIVIGVLVVAFLLLRTPKTEIEPGTFDAVVTTGEPVVLNFYSNRCPQCLAAKPIMERLENQLAGQAVVINLNVMDRDVGLPAVYRYGVRSTPTLVVVDGCGEMLGFYPGIPQPRRIINTVENAPTCTVSVGER